MKKVRTGSTHEIVGRFALDKWKALMVLWYNKISIACTILQQHSDIGIAA